MNLDSFPQDFCKPHLHLHHEDVGAVYKNSDGDHFFSNQMLWFFIQHIEEQILGVIYSIKNVFHEDWQVKSMPIGFLPVIVIHFPSHTAYVHQWSLSVYCFEKCLGANIIPQNNSDSSWIRSQSHFHTFSVEELNLKLAFVDWLQKNLQRGMS